MKFSSLGVDYITKIQYFIAIHKGHNYMLDFLQQQQII